MPLIFPPGELIWEEAEYRGWSKSDLAVRLGMPPEEVDDLLDGTMRITPEVARKIAQAFGTSSGLWVRMDEMYVKRTFLGSVERVKSSREITYLRPEDFCTTDPGPGALAVVQVKGHHRPVFTHKVLFSLLPCAASSPILVQEGDEVHFFVETK